MNIPKSKLSILVNRKEKICKCSLCGFETVISELYEDKEGTKTQFRVFCEVCNFGMSSKIYPKEKKWFPHFLRIGFYN